MKRYSAILFDIDGTLIDLDAVVKGVNKALEDNGLEKIPREKMVKKLIGYQLTDKLPEMIGVTKEQAEKVREDYTNYYLNHNKESDPYPGTKETLSMIMNEGLKIGLVTTKRRSEALATIDNYPEIIYDALIGGDDTEETKPSPEPIERACEELDINPKEALYIGDHIADVEAGKAAGCNTVGVTTGVHGRDKLEEAGADHVIDKIEEVIFIAEEEAEEIEKSLRIPKDRIGALIGKKGRTKSKLENETKVSLDINSKTGEINIKRYIGRAPEKSIKAIDIVKAIGNGFSPQKAFKLLEPQIYIEVINLRDYAGRSNKEMKRIKSRLIGKKGKARKNLEEITSTDISIKDKKVSIIGEIENIELAKKGVIELIEGSPHNYVYEKLVKKKRKNKMI